MLNKKAEKRKVWLNSRKERWRENRKGKPKNQLNMRRLSRGYLNSSRIKWSRKTMTKSIAGPDPTKISRKTKYSNNYKLNSLTTIQKNLQLS